MRLSEDCYASTSPFPFRFVLIPLIYSGQNLQHSSMTIVYAQKDDCNGQKSNFWSVSIRLALHQPWPDRYRCAASQLRSKCDRTPNLWPPDHISISASTRVFWTVSECSFRHSQRFTNGSADSRVRSKCDRVANPWPPDHISIVRVFHASSVLDSSQTAGTGSRIVREWVWWMDPTLSSERTKQMGGYNGLQLLPMHDVVRAGG